MIQNIDNNCKKTDKKNLTITICSTKGGVGKTTLTANTGGFLADLIPGSRVLLIDGDPQGTLSKYYTIRDQSEYGLRELVKNEGDPLNTISKTTIDNLDIVTSNDPNGKLQTWITSSPTGRLMFKQSLNLLKPYYDYIVIDSQGTNEPLQHVTVLAGDMLVSPIPPDIVSSQEFQLGTLNMLSRLEPLAAMTGYPLGQLYGLIYKKKNTKDAQLFADELVNLTFAESKTRIRILKSIIPDIVAYQNASTAHQPVHRIDPKSKAQMAGYVSEILPNLAGLCEQFAEGKS